MSHSVIRNLSSIQKHFAIYCAILVSLGAGFLVAAATAHREIVLEIRMLTSAEDTAQVFFDIGNGYNEQDSSTAKLTPGPAQAYRFRLPAKRIRSLRFDPLVHEGRVTIIEGTIVDNEGNILRRFPPSAFIPQFFLQKIQESNSQVTFQTVALPGQVLDPTMSILNSSFKPSFRIPFAKAALWSLLFLALFIGGSAAFKWTRKHSELEDSELHFRIACLIALLVTLVYAVSFPLIATYDGMEYVHLSNVLFADSFSLQWNYLRTPLFPLALRLAFELAGEQPSSAMLVSASLGLGGILLAGSTIRKLAGGTTGAAAMILLSFYPTLVGYEHMLLSETGTFFFLALLVWLLAKLNDPGKKDSVPFACFVALAIAVGYYWRPTILYLSPCVALLYAWTISHTPNTEIASAWRQKLRFICPPVLIVLVAPWLIASPWLTLTADRAPGISETILTLGLYKQALVPAEDPIWGPLKDQYEQALKQNSKNGKLALDGIAIGDSQELMNKSALVIKHAGVKGLILKYPFRYAVRVLKSMAFFMGAPGYRTVDDESGNFTHTVLAMWRSEDNFDNLSGWDRSFLQFTPPPHRWGFDQEILNALSPVYKWLVGIASMVSIGWLVFSIWRADPVPAAVSAIPLTFLLIHALTLFAETRYAFPVYPLLLANLVLVIGRCLQGVSRRRSQGTLSLPQTTSAH